MEELPYQIKALVHHILHRQGVYKLEMSQLHQMLLLLREAPSEDPKQIQERLFRGIVRFNRHYQDQVSLGLSGQIFDSISQKTKSLMHKILHEFYFLISIKAWEMFLPHFQQPAKQSQPVLGTSTGPLLDDEYEKARLHYMYYGPMNVYNTNLSLPPLPPPSQPFIPQPRYPQYNDYQKQWQNQAPALAQGRHRLIRYNGIEQDRPPFASSKKEREQTSFNPLKKKKLIKNSKTGSSFCSDKGGFLQRLELQNKAIGQQAILKNCLCGGAVKLSPVFRCKCKKYFHTNCQRHESLCLVCRQAEFDPFFEVVSLIDSFTLNFDTSDKCQGQFNLSRHLETLKTNQYQVILSCSHPDHTDICWPDDTRFLLNDLPVFEIPALLQSHSQRNRKDKQLVITPYLSASLEHGNNLGQIRFGMQVMKVRESPLKRRNNRSGNFQLCLFLVKIITPDQIFMKIVNQFDMQPEITPFKRGFADVMLESLEVSFSDPYSSQVIDIPARGSQCKHLPCFDLKTYLTVTCHIGGHSWTCPYCLQDSRQLIIDNYLLSLLNKYKKEGKIPKKVTFWRDGRRECLVQEEEMSEQ